MRCYACVALLLTLQLCACEQSEPPTRARAPHRVRVGASVAEGDGSATPADDRSPIARENESVGTDAYGLQQPARGHQVEAYASASSVAAGEELRVFVNVERAQSVSWELYRLGYYHGRGARQIAAGVAEVAVQPACPVDSTTGLIECAWSSAFAVTVDSEWISGFYLFKLTSADGFDAHVPVIVRESTRRAPILVQASVNTWQAYNLWGGTSLYRNTLPDKTLFKAQRATRVSFDRPYALANVFETEAYMARFLEQRGYDVAYVTNVDLDADPELLRDRKLFMTVAHDEYWSVPERDALEAARDDGVSLAFFSANTGYWRVRLEQSSSGGERRIITCYKSAKTDPHGGAVDTTNKFRSTPHARPENALLGVMYGDWTNIDGFAFVVSDPAHWIYGGTGVRDGDALGNVVGIEWDGVDHNGAEPPNLEVVSASPAISEAGSHAMASAAVHYPTSSSFVFAAGAINWPLGLGHPRYIDSRLQRMTENVLARAGFALAQPTEAALPPTASGERAARTRVIAGSGEQGASDGAAAVAQFSWPAAVARGPDGELYVADAGNNAVRKIASDGTVSTLTRCVSPDSSDCLANPTGIAVDAQGVIYVSDTANSRIRRISPDGTMATFAGSGAVGPANASDPLAAAFYRPRGLALGPAGELYVADGENGAIRRIDASGVDTVASGLAAPTALAVDSAGAVYVATSGDGRIHELRDGMQRVLVNASGVLGDADGPGPSAALRPMEGLSVSVDGSALWIADTANNRVRRLSLADGMNMVTSVTGPDPAAAPSDAESSLHLLLPRGIAPFDSGYAIADSAHHRIVWLSRELAPSPESRP